MENKKIIYYLVKAMDACFFYRIKGPSKYLERDFGWKCYFDLIDDVLEKALNGEPTSKIKESRLEFLKKADIVVIERGTDQSHLDLVKYIKKVLKKPIIFEGDDIYFDKIPESNTGYRYFQTRSETIKEIISICDGMTVSTDFLKKFYSAYNDNIKVFNNYFDFEFYDKCEIGKNEIIASIYRTSEKIEEFENKFPESKSEFKEEVIAKTMSFFKEESIDKIKDIIKRAFFVFNIPISEEKFLQSRQGKTVIGWGGSPTHVLDIEITREAINDTMNKYQDLLLVLVGFDRMAQQLMNTEYKDKMRKWVTKLPLNRFWSIGLVPTAKYYGLYKKLNFDIGIAPVAANDFNRAKSPIKIQEYMIHGTFPIASKFDTYESVIGQGKGQGLLCYNNTGAWKKSLVMAINEPEMRKQITDYNKHWIRENYDLKDHVQKLDEIYRSFL